MDWSQCNSVDRDPGKLGGEYCFAGTRVSVATLFDHLDRGSAIDEFLEWFPSVSAEQVHAVLDFAKRSLDRSTAVA